MLRCTECDVYTECTVYVKVTVIHMLLVHKFTCMCDKYNIVEVLNVSFLGSK